MEAHVGRLQACFEAALPPLPWLPSVLAEALERVYRRAGWTLTDVADDHTRYGRTAPTMRDFYRTLGRVVAGRDYGGETGQNVRAATLGRVKQLLLGSVGFMLGGVEADNVPPDLLFGRPVVLELNDLNLQDKALMMTFLLTFLREYREAHAAGRLVHLTVIEEAHNVLGQVESQGTGEGAGADTRAKSVEAFCNLLAEVRSLGEGLVIADQSPNKLAPDALRNTNVQIAHQLRDGRDRQAVAGAMIMDDEQRDFLGKVPPGRAAVFFTGLQKATFLTAPDYRRGAGQAFADDISAGEVRARMDALVGGYRRTALPYAGCRFCPVRRTCDHRPAVLPVAAALRPLARLNVRQGALNDRGRRARRRARGHRRRRVGPRRRVPRRAGRRRGGQQPGPRVVPGAARRGPPRGATERPRPARPVRGGVPGGAGRTGRRLRAGGSAADGRDYYPRGEFHLLQLLEREGDLSRLVALRGVELPPRGGHDDEQVRLALHLPALVVHVRERALGR